MFCGGRALGAIQPHPTMYIVGLVGGAPHHAISDGWRWVAPTSPPLPPHPPTMQHITLPDCPHTIAMVSGVTCVSVPPWALVVLSHMSYPAARRNVGATLPDARNPEHRVMIVGVRDDSWEVGASGAPIIISDRVALGGTLSGAHLHSRCTPRPPTRDTR